MIQRIIEFFNPSRQRERERREALAGRRSSGYLGAGERDRLFREAKQRRSRRRR